MIQENELKEIAAVLDKLGITIPDMWADITMPSKGMRIAKRMRKDNENLQIIADLNRNENLGIYSFEGYKANLLRLPDIKHGVFNGVDTLKLDKALDEISWNSVIPGLHFKDGQIQELLQQVGKLMESGIQKGMEAGELLLLKHIAYTPIESLLIPHKRRAAMETSAFIAINGNDQDLDVYETARLLSGRAVAKPLDTTKGDLCWLTLDQGEVRKLPDFDLDEKLSALPFQRVQDLTQRVDIIAALGRGRQLEDKFRLHGHSFTALYQADPVSADIALFTVHNQKLNLEELRNDPNMVKSIPERPKVKENKGLKL